jgi:hypothetical protein
VLDRVKTSLRFNCTCAKIALSELHSGNGVLDLTLCCCAAIVVAV